MRGDSAGSLLALDRSHVWHPYDSMPALREPLLVESASGVRLQLARPVAGRIELIDGMSSWWSAIHGYRHLVLDTALRDQVSRMSHVMFGGLTHESAIRLCARLSAIAPPGLARVFLCDSGSVAVEVAMKMALQYQRAVGRANRTRFLTWRGGYHGDTFLAMSVCDPVGGMHGLWTDLLPAQVFADVPPAGHDAAVSAEYVRHLEEIAGRSRDSLAGVIVEPVVQGAGGMRFHNPAYLGVLRRLADAHGLPLIFDEIATGFGRTGTLFAAERAGVAPDIMCVGKGMTGGYVSMAAALCTDEIASGISAGEVPVLAHGPTFMGNPLAAAVAGASIDLLLSSDWAGAVARIERELRTGLEEARTLPAVVDVRTLGAIGVIELAHPVDVAAAAERAAGEGVWLRPFRNLVYAMPPFVSGPEEVAAIARAMVAAATT